MPQPSLLPAPIDAEPVVENETDARLESLEEEVSKLRMEMERNMRQISELLHSGRVVFGTAAPNAGPMAGPPTSALQPPNPAAWAAWKAQLPDSCGKVIDALMVQPLKASQMIALCKLAYPTITAALRILERNGLIEKDGRLIRLKRL